ncbi:hypothetical protein FSP39_018818 [Pinctada imbricata]|uniref:Copper transport protein n=1 Tax=Pinctada imbricata TaxID=66713 RepID=A0AA88XN71_PINIB|nr:hypothetical protein FSP39_018818 [Pinctada imbricata]
MWFYWTTKTKHLLFKGVDINGTTATFEACVVLFLATFILEGGKCIMLYWNTRLAQHPLTYGQTDHKHQDRNPLFNSLMIPSSLEHIKRRRAKYHIFSCLSHIFNLILGYLVMLAVMRYSIWMLVAVLLGSMVGYFIFGALGHNVQLKYTSLLMVKETMDIGHINHSHEYPDGPSSENRF